MAPVIFKQDRLTLFKKKTDRVSTALARLEILKLDIISNSDNNRYDELFIRLVYWLRSRGDKIYPIEKMNMLLEQLKKNTAFLSGLQGMFRYFFSNKDFTSLFTEVGILRSGSLFSEVAKAVNHKILPPLPNKRSMEYLLNRAFDKERDYKFVRAIPDSMWVELFELVGKGFELENSALYSSLSDALTILSYRVLSIAYKEDLSRWRSKSGKHTLLLEQNKQSVWLVHILNDADYDRDTVEAYIAELDAKLEECQAMIKDIESNSVVYGTSLEQSYLLSRTKQQLFRMRSLLQIFSYKYTTAAVAKSVVQIFSNTIEHINKQYKISHIISRSVGLLAFQVSEHKRETGEHYITTTRRQYFAFFWSAVKGGLVICIAAFIKALLHYVHMPAFWEYFTYGFNYSIAFVFMYLTHSSLATKQPAMTAAALAAAMDDRSGERSVAKISIVFARVWRSQFASFMGNILTVFPVSLGIAMLAKDIYKDHLLNPPYYALDMIRAQNPTASLCLLFAAFTGVFLFLSGIITGYVDNKVIHSNLPNRILEHPTLKKYLNFRWLSGISRFVKNHLGSVTGNVFLGMALGFAPMIGDFLGIPFDIRHITISTAFYAFGVVGREFELLTKDWFWTSLGIILIGFINFAVSFGLAFITAMRSRNVSFATLPSFMKGIRRMFVRYPVDFIFPPGKPRTPEDLS